MKKRMLHCLVALILITPLWGHIYFWTDEEGIRHYSNVSPPEEGPVKELAETRAVFKALTHQKGKGPVFHVLKVYDGDTIQVSGLGLVFKVRLVGIDAPEIGYRGKKNQPFSEKSKAYLQSRLDKKQVGLKSYGIGGYNRQLAEVFADNVNINIEMIKAGLAEVYRGKRPDSLNSRDYFEHEAIARKARLGIWRLDSAYKSPRQWRKEDAGK